MKSLRTERKVLAAIRAAGLPLSAPDEDVEPARVTDESLAFPFGPPLTSFVSHTSANADEIRARILPVVEPFFGSVLMMNFSTLHGRATSSSVIQAYKRRILTGLMNSGWIIVVISKAAITSRWVGFEFAWALRHREHERIIAVTLDDDGMRAFYPVLQFVRTVRMTQFSWWNGIAIKYALRKSGALRIR